MSNYAYITTRKYIKSYDISALLQKINEKRFDGKMTIKKDHAWTVEYQNGWEYSWDGLDFYQDTAKKLHLKHPHNPWMQYVFVVFVEELGALTNAILSDEGTDDRWKPNPQRYSSYGAWIDIMYSRFKKTNPTAFQDHKKFELSLAPKGMEKY